MSTDFSDRLASDIKTLNDDLIGDFIDLKIDDGMSVSTLYALEAIFHMRLQLAQIGWEDNVAVYNRLYIDRLEQIGEALRKKYNSAQGLNERIEILDQIDTISQTLYHAESDFAFEEASRLLDDTTEELTYSQQLRLEWITGADADECGSTVRRILSGQTPDSFDMMTIAEIIDSCSREEQDEVFERYIAMVKSAITANDTVEVGNLLALGSYWNINPILRPHLTEVADKAQSVTGLSLPERRVNLLAAEIYNRIDAITGRYATLTDIPA